MKITRMTLLALSDAMQRGDLTSREVTQAYLDRIHQVEGKVQAYISLNEEEALVRRMNATRSGSRAKRCRRFGHSRRREGQHLRQGRQNHLRIQNAGGFRIAVLRHGLGKIAGGGLRPARQDESG